MERTLLKRVNIGKLVQHSKNMTFQTYRPKIERSIEIFMKESTLGVTGKTDLENRDI